MQIAMTIGERIRQVEKLPRYGSLNEMYDAENIRKKLVGFAGAQLTSYRIVYDGERILSGVPDTPTNVTFEDDLIVGWAKIIRKHDIEGSVEQREAELYRLVCQEAERIESESSGDSGSDNGDSL